MLFFSPFWRGQEVPKRKLSVSPIYLIGQRELTLHELGITLLQMAFIRTKRIKGKTYYYLVESYRDPKTKRVKQRVLKYLGNQRPEGWQPKKKGDNK